MTMPVSHVTVRVPLTIRRRPGRKTLVSLGFGADGGRIATKADPALVKVLARAFRYQKLLDEGRYASISEMAAGEKIERGYLGTVLRLTLLAPEWVEAILNGRHPERVTLPRLLEGLPVWWGEQRGACALRSGFAVMDHSFLCCASSRSA
jgi:hypothetical protein